MPHHWASRAHITHGRPAVDVIRRLAARGYGPYMAAAELGVRCRNLHAWLRARDIRIDWPTRSDSQRTSHRLQPRGFSRREEA